MLADLDEDFVHHLRLLVHHLLAPKNFVKKEIEGHPMTAEDLFEMLPRFMEVFRDDQFQPTTFLNVIMFLHR